MINHLCCNGVDEAEGLLQRFHPADAEHRRPRSPRATGHRRAAPLLDLDALAQETFQLASTAAERGRGGPLHPDLDQGGELRASSTRRSRTCTRRSRTSRTPWSAFSARGMPRCGAPAGGADRAASRAAAPLLQRASSTSSTAPRTPFGSRTSTTSSRRTIHFPKSHGKLGGKSAGLFVASRLVERARRVRVRPERDSRPARPGTSPPTGCCSSSATTTWRTSTTASTGRSTRSARSTRTWSRSSRTRPSPRS